MDAIGRSWRRVTVRCTMDVCGGTVTSSYVSSHNLRCVPLMDATNALSRRVTVVCTMNACVDMAAQNRAGPKHAPSKGVTGSTMLRVSVTCTIIDSEEMAVLNGVILIPAQALNKTTMSTDG